MSFCSFVSSQYIASTVERSAALNTNITMTVLFGGTEGGCEQPGPGPEREAGKEEVWLKDRPPRTDALAVY